MIQKYWYLVLLFVIALVVNENIVQWALAVQVGGYTIAGGFEDAFEYFTIWGYFFLTSFRMAPYVGLGVILVILLNSKYRDFFFPVFFGGLIGILAMIIWGSWTAQLPYYTEEHVSSTTALAFLIIPVYAIVSGAVGAAIFAGIYSPFLNLFKKKKIEAAEVPG